MWRAAKLTIENLGSLGEFVAAIATIATLAYLALQIRQNTGAMRATSHQAATDSFNTVNMTLSRDPTLARIFRVGTASLKDLTEDERTQFSFLLLAYFRVWETLFYQSRVGTAEEELFSSELEYCLTLSGVREWWELTPYLLSSQFRSYVEEDLSKGNSIGQPAA